MSKYRVENSPKMNYDWVFHRKKGHSMSYQVLKIPKVLQKITSDLSKTKFQNGLNPKAKIFSTFGAKPPKKYVKMIANSD